MFEMPDIIGTYVAGVLFMAFAAIRLEWTLYRVRAFKERWAYLNRR